MTQDEIIEMGKKTNLCDEEGRDDNSIIITSHLEAFAKLVAAKEREACAKLADECTICYRNAAETIAIAIRARGEA